MRSLILFILSIGILSCSERIDHQKSFFANYSDYCGYAYKGQTNFVDLGSGEVFEGADLTMILRDCSDDEVRIPFHVDDDTSRTWIVKMTPDGLHLSHDHRYDDGTEHDNNFYGGYADDEGNAFLQYFPADERTIEDRPARSANRWAKEFDLSEMKYYYRLYLNDELRFEAEFDLVNPIEINP
ncbi:MAG: hypothetical protein EA390_15095 [Balneolaceae bacterium]|nr:MAG: hypothetical protein EA390_15095 [Balneolaceae bacterium]